MENQSPNHLRSIFVCTQHQLHPEFCSATSAELTMVFTDAL
jgi:hypothetical protein